VRFRDFPSLLTLAFVSTLSLSFAAAQPEKKTNPMIGSSVFKWEDR
jgi:hypothetical protein